MKRIILLLLLLSFNVFAAPGLPININTADAPSIVNNLSGVGLKKAEAIIEYRKVNGSFKRIEDLIKVKGIGKKTADKNKKNILFKSP